MSEEIRTPSDPLCAYCGELLFIAYHSGDRYVQRRGKPKGSRTLAFIEDERQLLKPRAYFHLHCFKRDPLMRVIQQLAKKGRMERARKILPVVLRWFARRGPNRVSVIVVKKRRRQRARSLPRR